MYNILIGARIDVKNKPTYVSKYYGNGYPPDNAGPTTKEANELLHWNNKVSKITRHYRFFNDNTIK